MRWHSAEAASEAERIEARTKGFIVAGLESRQRSGEMRGSS